ncbi:MAG: carboxypeptidase regulatory-like domain-containing protein [Verrucomicrobiota bacterium]
MGTLDGSGTIQANGAPSGNNGGGGGRIALYYWNATNLAHLLITENGGTSYGQPGTLFTSTQPIFALPNLVPYFHGTAQITWSAAAIDPDTTDYVTVTISHGGAVYLSAYYPAVPPTVVNWDSTSAPNGIYTLTATLFNSAGKIINQLTQDILVNNSAAWQGGTLTASQTWSSNAVIVVDQNVIIPSGVTLTVAPGAIVKFAPGTGIIIQAGGILDASGATASAPIIFTALSDNSVGGDTGEDPNAFPLPGDWKGISVSGQFETSPYVQVRYVIETESGTLSGSQEWAGSLEYVIAGNLTVPSGVTLTIDPGAIVKFDQLVNLTVQPGGTLVAQGTVAQPIVFTSINDQSVGADTNGVATTPNAGDWDSIYINGTGVFDHVVVTYGAGVNLPAGLITANANGAVVSIADSILSQGFYDGIQDAAGTVAITNCVVTGCQRGIQAGLDGNAEEYVVNCTLDGNNIGMFFHGGTVSVINTIIADSLQYGIADCCGSVVPTFRYNDVWSASGINYDNSGWPYPDQTGTNGNISVNPNFLNGAQGDFQLNYGSPCINAADGTVAPLTDMVGDPCYNDPRTLVKTGLTNANGVYPDMGAYEFVESAFSPVDLIVSSVLGPTAVTAGQTATVQWTDANIGTGDAVGPWHDTISLAPMDGSSNVLSVGVLLVAQGVTLGPGQSYTNSATVTVPGGTEGNYQWQVQVNSQGDVFEGVNWTNDITLAATPTSLTDPTLTVDGSALTNQFTAAGQIGIFEITPPTGASPVISVQGSTPGCALGLYVGDGYVPDSSHFDFESSQFNSPYASLLLANANGDNYYVTVYAQSLDAAVVAYTLSATIPSLFAVNSVSPGDIGANGTATIEILGSLLGLNDTYQLVGPGGAFSATSVSLTDPTTAYATFNLSNAAAGTYSLEVSEPNGPTVTISNSVTVVPETASPQLSLQLQFPPGHRQGRPFEGMVVYGNIGNGDMAAPILIVSTGHTAGLRLLPTDSFSTSDLLLIGAAMQGPAGILRPGQMWNIPFGALDNSGITIPFQVDYKTAEATDLVDYVTMGAQIRPAGYSDADWTELWNEFQAAAGPTWGGLIKLMGHYATIMAQETMEGENVGTFYSYDDVLAYALDDSLEQAQTSVAGTLYLSDTNHPLAHAFVYLSSTNAQTGADQSNPDGTFRILNLSSGAFGVKVPGYWLENPVTVTVPTNGPVTGVAVVVQPGGVLSGVVFNQFGATFLTNVLVTSTSETTGTLYTGATGMNGSFALTGLAPDTYDLTVGGNQYETQYSYGLNVSNGQVLSTNFYLAAGAGVEGQATGNGTALTNATVLLTDSFGRPTSATTFSNGYFVVNGESAGQYTFVVSAPGFAPYINIIDLATGQNTNVGVIALAAGGTISATLQNQQSLPIANGTFTLMQYGTIIAQNYSDTNGAATFSGLAAGDYALLSGAAGFQAASNAITVVSGMTVTNNSILTTLDSIAGQITDGSNAPVAGLTVNLYGTNSLGQGFSIAVVTDSNGDYSLGGLSNGTYQVAVGNGGGTATTTVTLSSSNKQATVSTTLSGPGIMGQVLASGGLTPVPGAAVTLGAVSGNLVTTSVSDSSGVYHFRNVSPGTYYLTAGTTNGISPSNSVSISGNATVFAPPLIFGPITLSGAITDQFGNPLAGASLELIPPGGRTAPLVFNSLSQSNGQYSFSGLTPGAYELLLHATGYARLLLAVPLTTSTNESFALPPGGAVQGSVVDGTTLLPVNGAIMYFIDPTTHIVMATAVTKVTGSVTAIDLGAGTYDVQIADDSHQIFQQPVTLDQPPYPPINVALPPTNTSLGGTLTDEYGDPVPDSIVEIWDDETGVVGTFITDTNGSWSTSQLPPGHYTVWDDSNPDDFGTGVTLVAGNSQTLDHVMIQGATGDDDADEDMDEDPDTAATSAEAWADDIQDTLVNAALPDDLVNSYSPYSPNYLFQDLFPADADCDCATNAHQDALNAYINLAFAAKAYKVAYNNFESKYGNYQSGPDFGPQTDDSSLMDDTGTDITNGLDGPISTIDSGGDANDIEAASDFEDDVETALQAAQDAFQGGAYANDTQTIQQLQNAIANAVTNAAAAISGGGNTNDTQAVQQLQNAIAGATQNLSNAIQTGNIANDQAIFQQFQAAVLAALQTAQTAIQTQGNTADIQAFQTMQTAVMTTLQNAAAAVRSKGYANDLQVLQQLETALTAAEQKASGTILKSGKPQDIQAFVQMQNALASAMQKATGSLSAGTGAQNLIQSTSSLIKTLATPQVQAAKKAVTVMGVEGQYPGDTTSINQALSDLGQKLGNMNVPDWAGAAAANQAALDKAQADLADEEESTESFGPGNPEGIICTAVNQANTWVGFTDEYANDKNNLLDAQLDYELALADMTNALDEVDNANNDCDNCPPQQPNATSIPDTITGPSGGSGDDTTHDPNDKLATGVGPNGFVRPGQQIYYTVDFQNQPTATAPVQTLLITDPLNTNLDWSTLQLGAIGFNNVTIPVSPGVQSFSANVNVATDPNPVQVTASLDPTNGVLTWYMQSTDPVTGQLVTDPLAGFLPPDTTNGVGEGYVTYTVQAKQGLTTGTIITNQATIVFDANAPMNTPITTNTMDATPPASSVTPLPPLSVPVFNVSWSGEDTTGPGIAGFNIYVSTDGRPWTLWLSTTNTSAMFTGAYNNTYAFYSVAYDELGNMEANPIIPGASTIVAPGSLQVTITPANAVAAGAEWQVDGGAWQTNGAVVSGLSVETNHTLAFKVIYGWSTPSNQMVTITGGATTTNSGVYTTQKVKDVTLTITSPKPGQKLSLTNAGFTVTGSAKDALPAKEHVAVESVYYQLNETNDASWTLATPSNSWSDWTAGVILNPGANTIRAYAVDAGSNASSITKVAFNYIPSAVLDLKTNGLGAVTPNDGGKLLAIKTNYTLTATPGRNWLFSSWVASGSTNFVSNTPVLKFAMQSNLTLQANFVTNVFLAAKGTYIGLFAPTNAPRRQTNSGAFKFTVTSTGALSGKLTIGSGTLPLSGQFDPAGFASFPTPRKGLSTLTNTLQLDFVEQMISGSVTDGSFDAQVIADLEQKTTNYEGQYTLIIPGTNEPTAGPYGPGYLTVSVTASGGIAFSGSLADGTTVTPMTSVLSKDGYWPFYVPLYGNEGSLWGWNIFTNHTIISAPFASWINATNSSKGAVYRSGFTNQERTLTGWFFMPSETLPADMTATLEGGDLPFAITNGVTISTTDQITLTNKTDETNKLKLTVQKSTGVITGSFANPANPKETIKVNGVITQRPGQTNAQGYFLGTDQSGVFTLDPP